MIDISYMDGASANPHRIAQGLVRKCEVVHSGKTTRGLGQEEPPASGIRTNRQGRAVTDTCPPLVLWRAPDGGVAGDPRLCGQP
jgi:hypothetical protein